MNDFYVIISTAVGITTLITSFLLLGHKLFYSKTEGKVLEANLKNMVSSINDIKEQLTSMCRYEK